MQDNSGSIKISVETYSQIIETVEITNHCRMKRAEPASDAKLKVYRSLPGQRLCLGCGMLAQELLIASRMQQKLPRILDQDICKDKNNLKEMKDLQPMIVFRNLDERIWPLFISTLIEAAFNISSQSEYRQTGVLIGIEYESSEEVSSSFYCIDWCRVKQQRICHSSCGAKINVWTVEDDCGYALKMTLQVIFELLTIFHVVHVDSKRLFDTITTPHEGREFCLRQTDQRIRDLFEQDINVFRLVPSRANIAEGFTKRNLDGHRLLSDIQQIAFLVLPHQKSFDLDSKPWI